jgi:hypothetical protein
VGLDTVFADLDAGFVVMDFEVGFLGLEADDFAAACGERKHQKINAHLCRCERHSFRTFLLSDFLLVVFFFASPIVDFLVALAFFAFAAVGFLVGLAAAEGFFTVRALDFAGVAFVVVVAAFLGLSLRE